MNDDELKKLWQQQPLREPDLSAEQLLSAMKGKMAGFRLILLSRDIVELLACAVVIIIFGIFYLRAADRPVSRLGDLIVIGSAIFIGVKLVYARRTTPPAPPGATVVESLRAELNAVRAQSRLLGSVAWWYLLPLAIGIFVCSWGMFTGGLGSLVVEILYTLGVIALYAWIYRLNQRARAKHLLPLEAQLQSLLHSAETGEPLPETEMAHLRPIALSLAAAGQVKPAEFKVAFWQIAILGAVGFIGIWFFLMLGLTVNNNDWKTGEHAPATFAQRVPARETNRYSVLAGKVVNLLNAGDYAAVQKLYNPEMSQAFPPKRTSEFYTRLAAGVGHIETVESLTTKGYQGWPAFRLHCRHGELTMSLALDANDQIAGIYFQPAHGPAANIGLLLRQVFRWQLLVWIVPFLFAGLFYSWLVQKWTVRAVGISTLGVHLHKGLTLILWDEIKEVRPLRILHIRNLWLIKESGEKMLMHWTSLERHADLKAAVEGFAPANHPIRKYLPLL
jgi:hypothetical protein